MQHNRFVHSIMIMAFFPLIAGPTHASSFAQVSDPGVRPSATNAPPRPLPGLGPDEMVFFKDGLARFAFIELASGGNSATNTGNGLGPRFNSNQCSS